MSDSGKPASTGKLVSIGLPVRNAGGRVAAVVRSVLAQDHENLELLITDNASTDDTEAVCRDLAAADSRITYHRQPQNIGLLNNFGYAISKAKGSHFRWIGDDDRLDPGFVSRCLEVFAADPRLILVTTGISYTAQDGKVESATYSGSALGSDDPVERLTEMLRLLNASYLLIDPLYGMVLREPVAALPRRNMLREDEVFAAKLALAGPWGHTTEILAHRHWTNDRPGVLASRLGVPVWQSHFTHTLELRELFRWLRVAELTDEQRRRARAAVRDMYLARQATVARRRARKLLRLLSSR
jgi:glycosyltransferase involved in cell wall biosynthesis